jgi:PhnB protein
MSKVSVYLNFPDKTEEAFNFYKSVFGGEFDGGITRFGDVPPTENVPELSESDKKLVMHVLLRITGGFKLMGSDVPASIGSKVIIGNNVYINLEPDTREETRQLFHALANGGEVEMELQEMFWGDYYGRLTDQFGVRWMFNCTSKE